MITAVTARDDTVHRIPYVKWPRTMCIGMKMDTAMTRMNNVVHLM